MLDMLTGVGGKMREGNCKVLQNKPCFFLFIFLWHSQLLLHYFFQIVAFLSYQLNYIPVHLYMYILFNYYF